MKKYNKEQISLCIDILKSETGCQGIVCSKCSIKKECFSPGSAKIRTAGEAAIEVIKEIIE